MGSTLPIREVNAVQQDDRDHPLSDTAKTLLRHSRVLDLRTDAADLSALFTEALPDLTGLDDYGKVELLAHSLISQRLLFREWLVRLLG